MNRTALSKRLIRLFLVAAIMLGGGLACRHGEKIATITAGHPNGLSVTLPTTLDVSGLGPQRVSVEATQNGFAVAVAREHVMRYTNGATVDLHTEAAAAPGRRRNGRRAVHTERVGAVQRWIRPVAPVGDRRERPAVV
jgi:hypothetical protein